MRSACGLPLRKRNLQTEEGLDNLLNADADSDAEQGTRDATWTTLRESLVTHMLDKELEGISFYEFKKMPMSTESHPNLTRKDMWDALEKEEVARKGINRGKTGKEKPGVYFPLLKFKKDFATVCPVTPPDDIRCELDEEHDVGLARRYAYRCRGRALNAENMMTFYCSMLPNPQKKGRRTHNVEELMHKCHGLVQKAKDHEDRLAALVAPTPRRLSEKKSAQGGAAGEALAGDASPTAKWPSHLVAKTVSYKYSPKQSYSIQSCRYSGIDGAQAMSKRLLKHVVDPRTVDMDILNCAFTLLSQIMKKTEPQPPLPSDLSEVLDEIVNSRSTFLAKLDVEPGEGKKIINTVLHGGAPPDHLKKNGSISSLQKISVYLRWMAMNLLYGDYMSLQDSKDKDFPSSTIMSLLWQAAEDVILQAWTEHVYALKPKHLSLHFDGIRVSKSITSDMAACIEQCQKTIRDKTTFDVKISIKTHSTFRELVQEHGAPCSAGRHIPAELLSRGNCIPCSLWHCYPTAKTAIAAFVKTTRRHRRMAIELTELR